MLKEIIILQMQINLKLVFPQFHQAIFVCQFKKTIFVENLCFRENLFMLFLSFVANVFLGNGLLLSKPHKNVLLLKQIKITPSDSEF